MLTQAPKGTKDIFGNEVLDWQEVESKMRDICKTFGIEEIRTPMFEHTELFLRGVGDTTDIVQKEMYTFNDKADRSITLKPESTAGVARAFIEYGMHNNTQPTKFFYISPTFRYENTQAGRQRQFHQFGIEMFGSYDAALDAEAISVAAELVENLGIKNIELRINSLGCPDCREVFNKKLRMFIEDNVLMLCPECKERYKKNPLRVLDCKVEKCQNILKNAPDILECLDDDCTVHFTTLKENLDAMGIEYIVDSKIVRGLDYYTQTVFEFITNSIGSQGTVCGGGRYNNLVEECGGQKTGAVGFGLGIERLLLTLEAQNGKKKRIPRRHVYIGSAGREGKIKSQAITYKLRKKGVIAECDTVGRSVKAQMKYANKVGAMYSLIIGEEEMKNNMVILKDMSNSSSISISLDEFEDKILEIVLEL